uniref:Uncharacterized protein n=1 Tax=Branchiostoma floridae TaxID=7739 RepID=C3XYP3_BRAFL|eukprot:XP_002610918.1 hypothetical protein BRAFLDRAFT_91515 [Branchiostoma floridae]
MAAAATEDFHRESGDGLCGDFSCPHCAFSVDQDVMLKVLKHFFNCTSLQYIIDLSVGNAASLGAAKHSAPRRASKAPQPHSEPVRHAEPPTKRRATEARATPPQESPRIVTTQAPTLLARLNAAQSRTQTVSQREIPPEPEHHTRPRQVETVQPRAPETTTTTTTSAASVELPSITTIKEEPGAGAACIVEPTAPTLFDDPMHTQKDTDSAMGMKRDTDNVGSMLDALPGTSSSGLFSEDLNFGGAGPSFVQSDPSQEDSTSGNVPRFVWNVQPGGYQESWAPAASKRTAGKMMADMMAESGTRKKRGNYATYSPEIRARIAKMCIEIGPQRTAACMSIELGRQLNESTVRYIKNSFNQEVQGRPVSIKGSPIGGVLDSRRHHLQLHMDKGGLPNLFNVLPESGTEHIPMKIPGREKVCKWCSLQKKKQAVRGRTSETTFACSVCHVRLHPKMCFDSYHQWAMAQRADRGLRTTGERGLASGHLGENMSSDEEESPNRMYVETESLPITSTGPRLMDTVSLEEDRTISIRQSVAGSNRLPGVRPAPSATVSKPGPEIEIVSVKSPATSRISTGAPGVRTTMQSSPQHLAQGQVNAGMGQQNPQPRIINTVSLSRPQVGAAGQDRPTSRVAFPSTSQQTQQPRPVACFKAPMRELPTPLPLPDFANSEDTQLRHAARSGNLHMYRTHIVRECAKFYSRMKPNLSRQDYARIGEAMTTAYPWLQGKGATPWSKFTQQLTPLCAADESEHPTQATPHQTRGQTKRHFVQRMSQSIRHRRHHIRHGGRRKSVGPKNV